MPNSGLTKRAEGISVLVRDTDRQTSWQLAQLREWRWINQKEGMWEGLVDGDGSPRWVDGSRLRRVSG